MWTAARTCRKTASLKMREILAWIWLSEARFGPVSCALEQVQRQRFAPGSGPGRQKKEEDIGVEFGKKYQGRTYNFKPAVLVHFGFAADSFWFLRSFAMFLRQFPRS